MPCDTIATSTVEFKSENSDFLKRALEALGYSVSEANGAIHGRKSYFESVIFENGSLTIRSNSGIDANAIKRAYSREVVTFASKKFGWQLKENSENKFAVQKRGF